MRKNVKDSDDKGGADADAMDLEDVSLATLLRLGTDEFRERQSSRSWFRSNSEIKL